MADTLNKPKLQLRSSFNTSDKTPSPATKLLISHGKPNFTIQKSPKENGTSGNPLSPQIQNLNNNNNDSFANKNNENNVVNNNNNNNYNPYKTASVVKSTKFNGVFNAASVSVTSGKAQSEANEANKVILRKVAKAAEPELRDGEDENVPEFIRRQRRIQERLAKENVLDFENRRSGYFTHVMITPTSPNRTSFSETMASPAVVPSLEMPAPPSPQPQQSVQEETEEEVNTERNEQEDAIKQTNGHVNTPEEEEEVAKAIEEVNKAVAGEDDNSATEQTEEPEQDEQEEPKQEQPKELEQEQSAVAEVESVEEVVTAVGEVEAIEVPAVAAPVPQARTLIETDEAAEHTNGNGNDATEAETHEHIEANVEVKAEAIVEEVVAKAEMTVASMEHSETNGDAAEHAQTNGHAADGANDAASENVTISHTNGVHDGPHIPAPDPSGALGVNYEPKTVVSFSKDLGADVNKYPDTVVVQKEVDSGASTDPALQEMAKLKFDIKADDADVQVTPVLRTE